MNFLSALLVIAITGSTAQEVNPPTSPELSADHQPARLSALLAAKDYTTLGKTVAAPTNQTDLKSDLDWLRASTIEGNSAFISMLYARLLWNVGSRDADGDELRDTAAAVTLYAFAAIQIDGTRCGDVSAPGHRTDQLLAWIPEIWKYVQGRDQQHRDRIVSTAELFEKHTAQRRDAIGDVDFICRAGLEETTYNLQHGGSREVPTAPGHVGRTIETFGDGKYRPTTVPGSIWQPKAARMRAALHSTLAKLAAGSASPPLPTPTKP